MWEFLSRKKETPLVIAEPTVSTPPVPEGAPVVEQATEQATEQVNEKYAAILSQTGGQSAPSDGVVSDDASQVSQATDAASRVTQLVELAQVKGVAHAVAVARKLNDFYVLDTMHDELADRLYEALKAKGLIQGE
ncbi:MAG: hypothetical protein WBO92_00625 [Candidatus Moraniibacteriota bacterium]